MRCGSRADEGVHGKAGTDGGKIRAEYL
jgi:hypothetical protein